MLGVREDEGWGSRVDSNYWGEERVFVEVIAYIADKRKAAVDMKEVASVEGRQMVEVVEVVGHWLARGAVEVEAGASTAAQRVFEGGAVASTSEASLVESVFPPSSHFAEFEMGNLPLDWRASSSAGSPRSNLHLNIDIGVAGIARVWSMMVAEVLVAQQMVFHHLCSREDVELGNAWD
jgi:hypothetical protein